MIRSAAMTFFKNRKAWLEAALFILIPALVYLPNVFRFTFYRDDWYYIYDGLVLGPRAFLAMFEHLRPLRGPLFAGLFALFGADPLPYHLLLFAWRVIGGAGMFWLLRLLWPNQRQGAYWAALLFTVYPGFLWWVGGFEYQPMVLSLGFQVFSIAFMLKAITAQGRARKVLWTVASILFSWIYLGLVEYAIGMELFRLLCAYVLVSRSVSHPTLKRVWLSIKVSIPSLLGPLLFLVWRMFFFENWRRAADVGLQVGRISDAPQVAFIWLLHLFQSAVKVLFMAWTVPLHQYFSAETLHETVIGWSLAAGLVVAVIGADRLLFGKIDNNAGNGPALQNQVRERWEPIIIGLLGVLGAMIPIVAANRSVSFDRFSHYTLPASIAGITFLFGLWRSLRGEALRRSLVAVLVFSAALTHFNLSAHVAGEARILSGFWQQVAWRAPGILPGTTLVVVYPSVIYSESADLVWGPADIIYYPQARDEIPLRIPISAARMEPGLLKDVIAGGSNTQNYIIINVFRYDYDNLLVISQPGASSCVHVMDSRWPAFAAYENSLIVSIAGKSKVGNIQAEGESPLLPEDLFGPEPAHTWCYYYQRADLARQSGAWAEVARLGAEAVQKKLAASDPIEWIPFMQAHILLGDAQALDRLMEELKANAAYKSDRAYYKVQFCGSLHGLDAAGFKAPSEMVTLGENLFCR
jgi:hypothetical protein